MPDAYRRMRARRTDEPHRVATVLELLFDLCFVVAVAQASDRLHHDLIENHVGHGLTNYALVFFAIWWAWMNFTWFASAYETDDIPYRLAVFVQIAGALVIAAGVPRAFDQDDLWIVTLGYVLMRLAGVAQWLRAAGSDPEHRRTALRYAIGVGLLQVAWLARLAVPDEFFLPSVLVLIAAELLVPVWAERANPTTWHPHHIAERYGLFTIIVLGETVLAASLAFQSAFDAGGGGSLLVLAGFGMVIVFGVWWLYFDRPGHERLEASRNPFVWGYGHYAVFASVAALGAGLAVAADYDTHVSHLSRVGTGYAVAVPVAVFLLGIWALRLARARAWLYPVTAALILATPLTPVPVPLTATLLVGLVIVTTVPGRSAGRRSTAGADQSTG